jgi:hypothetical protein
VLAEMAETGAGTSIRRWLVLSAVTMIVSPGSSALACGASGAAVCAWAPRAKPLERIGARARARADRRRNAPVVLVCMHAPMFWLVRCRQEHHSEAGIFIWIWRGAGHRGHFYA